jgi:hypothetical protein
MTLPTGITATKVTGGISLQWTEGVSPYPFYEIWVSVNSGAYSLVTRIAKNIRTYIHTIDNTQTLLYKIRGITPSEFSKNAKGKWDYTNYTIDPMTEQDGSKLHVEYVRGNIVFASRTGYLKWSTDLGYSYREEAFADTDIITFAYIFSNGNVLFATNKNELWFSKDGLVTITQKYLKNADGSNFVYHTPINSLYPGIYFNPLAYQEPTSQNGLEMLVFGNYAMYIMPQMNGAQPSMIYYTIDKGETIKVAYRFGPNTWSNAWDNGTAGGGASGNQLGDLTNPISIVHIHHISLDTYTNEWWCSCGEGGTLLKGIYNATTDSWTWTRIINEAGKFYRSGGMFFDATNYYFFSDETAEQGDLWTGVWKGLKTDLLDYTKFSRIHATGEPLAPSTVVGNKIFAGHFNNGMHMTVSLDGGATWNTYQNIPSGSGFFTMMKQLNSKGEMLVTPYNWWTETPYGKQSFLIKFK